MTDSEMKKLTDLKGVLNTFWSPFVQSILPLPSNMEVEMDRLLQIAGIQVAGDPETALRRYAINEVRYLNFSYAEVEFLLDPSWKEIIDHRTAAAKATILEIFKLVETARGFQTYFTSMWYATLPCFDIQGLTSLEEGQTTMLRKCRWKGKDIACAALFDPFPTDQGMCCTFNMNKADQLFIDSQFTKLIMDIQSENRQNAFDNGTKPEWFDDLYFPEEGSSVGLEVVLDAHSDIIGPETVFGDFEGFKVLIDSPLNFPFVKKKGFHVKPGHENLIAISAVDIDADVTIKSVSPLKRKCLFGDETDGMIFHTVYTQANCFLECSMSLAHEEIRKMSNDSKTCTPWYLPFVQEGHVLCDPWTTSTFEMYMRSGARQSRCSHCLPDCQRTVYQTKVSTQAFRKCDERNLGMTQFCNMEKFASLPKPQIFGQQVLDEFKFMNISAGYLKGIVSNVRDYYSREAKRNTFHFVDDIHNAYERDIAVLNVYFESPTVLQFFTSPRLTWVDFFSNVGGLLGLCVGLSIVTVIELACLALKIAFEFIKG